LKLRTRERLAGEHKTWATTSLADSADTALSDGHHLHGSALCFYADSSPSQKPDGTALSGAQDRGRLWLDGSAADGLELKVFSDTGVWESQQVISGTPVFPDGIQIGASTAAGSLTLSTTSHGTGLAYFDTSGELAGGPLDTTGTPTLTFPAGVQVLPSSDGNGEIGTADTSFSAVHADKVWGAVGNDFADELDGLWDLLEYGKCYCFNDRWEVKQTRRLAQKGTLGVASETASVIARNKSAGGRKLPVAVAGVALAYVDSDYPPGTALCSWKEGFLTRAPWWVRVLFPERIVGIFLRDPGASWHQWQSFGRKLIRVGG
jgi:hypothetical protein